MRFLAAGGTKLREEEEKEKKRGEVGRRKRREAELHNLKGKERRRFSKAVSGEAQSPPRGEEENVAIIMERERKGGQPMLLPARIPPPKGSVPQERRGRGEVIST